MQTNPNALLTFNMKAIRQEELKTLTFEYRVAQAVQRRYAPQSLFGVMVEDLDLDGLILEVDLDDPFFRTMQIEVALGVDPGPIGLQSVHVRLEYGDSRRPESHATTDMIFDAQRPGPQRWAVNINERHDLTYVPVIEYHFDPQSTWHGRTHSYEVSPGRTEDRTLLLNPYERLAFFEVTMLGARLDPSEVESVDVALRHEGNGWATEKRLTVVPGQPTPPWCVRTERPTDPDAPSPQYSYALTYRLVGGTTVALPERTTTATAISLTSPFVDHIEPRIRFSFDNGRYDQVLIDLTYEDASSGHRVERRIEVDGNALAPSTARFGVLDGAPRTYAVQATLVTTTGDVARGPVLETDGEFLQVDENGTVVAQ
jgi:hypothetical protein